MIFLRNGSRPASMRTYGEGHSEHMISYKKLFEQMKKRQVSQYALIRKYGISPGQITRLKRNEYVSTHTIERFCQILDCGVADLMEYIPDEEAGKLQKAESEPKK